MKIEHIMRHRGVSKNRLCTLLGFAVLCGIPLALATPITSKFLFPVSIPVSEADSRRESVQAVLEPVAYAQKIERLRSFEERAEASAAIEAMLHPTTENAGSKSIQESRAESWAALCLTNPVAAAKISDASKSPADLAEEEAALNSILVH
jgi:hypothetical protein